MQRRQALHACAGKLLLCTSVTALVAPVAADDHIDYKCPGGVIGGLVTGIVVMILVMCGCCYGLCTQPQEAARSGDSKMPRFSKGCVCLWLCPIIMLLLAHIGTLVLFFLDPAYCWVHMILLANPGQNEYGQYFWMYYGGPIVWFPLNFLVVFLIWMFCCKAPKSDTAGQPAAAMDPVGVNEA